MSVFGPYDHYPGVVFHGPTLLDLQVRNREGVTAYRLWASSNAMNLYGSPVDSNMTGDTDGRRAIIEVKSGTAFFSPSARAQKLSFDEKLGNTTRIQFNLDDYALAEDPRVILGSQYMSYFRLQQKRKTTGWLEVQGADNTGDPILGPILVVPPISLNGLQQPAFMLPGFAPSNTGCTFAQPPVFEPDMQLPQPLHFVFAKAASGFTLRNIDADSDLLFSFGLGMPMTLLAQGESCHIDEEVKSQIKEIILASTNNGASCRFSIEAMFPVEGG